MLFIHFTCSHIYYFLIFRLGTELSDNQKPKQHSPTTNGTSYYTEPLPELPPFTGKQLLLYQIEGLIRKKVIYSLRNRALIFLQIFLPFLYIMLTLVITKSLLRINELPSIKLIPTTYSKSSTLLERNNEQFLHDSFGEIAMAYQELFDRNRQGTRLEETTLDMNEFFLNDAEDLGDDINLQYIFGATSTPKNKYLIAWYSLRAIHSLPVSLNLLHNAILRQHEKDFIITVTNNPVPYKLKQEYEIEDLAKDVNFQLIINVVTSFIFISAFYVIPYVKVKALST